MKLNKRIDVTTPFEADMTKKLEEGEVEVVVSNSGKDRQGETILLEGIDLKEIKKNPVVLWAHEYSGLPIGKITSIRKTAGNLIAKIKFATEIYEFANTVYQLILEEIINAVSIGGIVKEYDENDYTIIKKLEMVELSVVPVGAHPDALVISKSLNIKEDEFKLQYEDFVRRSLEEKLKAIPEDQVKKHIESLESLTSALKSTYKDFADTDDKPKGVVKKLIIVRQAAKQCDKQSELIIAAVNNLLKG